MKKVYTSIYFSLFLLVTGFAQVTPPMEVAFQAVLDEVIEEYGYVGVSASVKVGNTQWAGAKGKSSDLEVLSTEHTFGMGSITKTITSACILQMMEEGLLTLSDPLGDYLPTYANVDSTITIKELLYHTSGIYNYTNHPDFGNTIFTDPTKIYEQEEVLDLFVNAPSFVTGTKQEYSNTNYLLLGMIIEEIAGQPYYDEIRDRFNPMGDYPSFDMPPYDLPTNTMANLWLDPTGTGNPPQDLEAQGFSLNSFFSAAHSAGAYASTPTDLARWGYDLYSGELLAASSMDSLLDFHPFGLFGVIDYGLGVFDVNFSCGQGLGHNGNIIYTAACYYLPELDLSVGVMTNDASQLEDVGGVDGIADELVCLYQSISTSTEEKASQTTQLSVSPNPSSGVFTIFYELQTASEVLVYFYNEIGVEVERRALGVQLEGINQLIWENDLPSGLYTIKMQLDDRTLTKKVLKF